MTSVRLKCAYLPYTVCLQVLVNASNLFLESRKQTALCCLLKLKSVKLIFQCLKNSGAFAHFMLDCVAQYLFLLASFSQTHFAIVVVGSFMYEEPHILSLLSVPKSCKCFTTSSRKGDI